MYIKVINKSLNREELNSYFSSDIKKTLIGFHIFQLDPPKLAILQKYCY